MFPTKKHSRHLLAPLMLALMGTWAARAQSQTLADLYSAAIDYDASFLSAKLQYDATVAQAEQAKAALLPTVGLSATASYTNQAITEPTVPPPGQQSYNYQQQQSTVALSQPLYRPANLASYEQGKKQTELAQTQLVQAKQDLMVRVSQAYFDVLSASDNLEFAKRQKEAVAQQLAAAKRNFEVGTSTITDTREAQAQFDLVSAQEIAADNDLHVKSITLNQIVGKTDAVPHPLAEQFKLPEITPNDAEQWVTQALDNSPLLKQQQVAVDVAKLETQKAESGHKPTLDLTASYTIAGSQGQPIAAGYPAVDQRANVGTIGVTFNMPLFAGFAIQNRVKQTVALQSKAETDLEAARRSVSLGVRSAFFGLQSGSAQVKALEAAEASSQSALDANQLGYKVGVRINIDVLNAQSQLYSTKARLAQARYGVLTGWLKLHQAAGTLDSDKLQSVNALLAP